LQNDVWLIVLRIDRKPVGRHAVRVTITIEAAHFCWLTVAQRFVQYSVHTVFAGHVAGSRASSIAGGCRCYIVASTLSA
jgi:hypothetical protein